MEAWGGEEIKPAHLAKDGEENRYMFSGQNCQAQPKLQLNLAGLRLALLSLFTAGRSAGRPAGHPKKYLLGKLASSKFDSVQKKA